jgi:hypothetical protein
MASVLAPLFASCGCHHRVLTLWKHILPSFAERCRTWQRHSSCDYSGEESQKTTDVNDVFFSCSRGLFSDDFSVKVPNWADVAKYSTRAAISLIFLVPFVDPPLDGVGTFSSGLKDCRKCGKDEVATGGKLLGCSACRDSKYRSLTACKMIGKS